MALSHGVVGFARKRESVREKLMGRDLFLISSHYLPLHLLNVAPGGAAVTAGFAKKKKINKQRLESEGEERKDKLGGERKTERVKM